MPEVPTELIRECVQGDAGAWQLLMKRYGGLVAAAVRNTLRRVRRVPDSNEVEEVIQSIWVALCDDDYRPLRGFEAKCAFTTWLTVLSTRRTLDHLRTERRKGSLKNLSLDQEAADLLEDLRTSGETIAEDDRNLVFESLERVPPEDRLILKLYYLDGLSYRGVGRVLGVTANTVASHLERARTNVREALKKGKIVGSDSTEDRRPASDRKR